MNYYSIKIKQRINEVKDLKIFKLFYSKSKGNADESFENAYEKLKNMKNIKLNGQNNIINTI